jgi:hypothetical protein
MKIRYPRNIAVKVTVPLFSAWFRLSLFETMRYNSVDIVVTIRFAS